MTEEQRKASISCRYLEESFQECSKKGFELEIGVGTLGVDLRTRTKQLGTKEKARRKWCDVIFLLFTKNLVFQTDYMRIGVRKLLRMFLVPAREW